MVVQWLGLQSRDAPDTKSRISAQICGYFLYLLQIFGDKFILTLFINAYYDLSNITVFEQLNVRVF